MRAVLLVRSLGYACNGDRRKVLFPHAVLVSVRQMEEMTSTVGMGVSDVRFYKKEEQHYRATVAFQMIHIKRVSGGRFLTRELRFNHEI